MTDKYNQEQANQTTIKEHYSSIIQFKKTQAKITLLLSAAQTQQQQRQQLMQMKSNIQTALKQQLSTLRGKQKKDDLYPLSIQLLKDQDVGKLTKYFIQEDRKWKNAVVLQVDLEEQTAKIKPYGQNTEALDFPAYFLKVLKEPDAQLFEEGTHCKAIYSGDGQFYPCVIQKITQQGYHVRYKKYNSQEVIQLHRLRPMQNQNQKVEEVNIDNLAEFKIPDKLKILPNDPENVKKSKKNKIKALKFSHKNAQIQQQNKQKQQKWKNWNSNSGSASKFGHFKSKQDMQLLNRKK